jgi:hypothetical protein
VDILESSLNRAIRLLKTPANYDDYISIKLKPVPSGCCCFHCWSKTWSRINQYIAPNGPLRDEGDVLIVKNSEKFVLECHESGPEIIVYLGVGVASITLVKSIVDLIATMLKTQKTEPKTASGRIKISKRRVIKGQIETEDLLEIELPLSDEVVKIMNEKIEMMLKH